MSAHDLFISLDEFGKSDISFSQWVKETKSATMNIFRFFYFVFKAFVKVELSYAFTINLFTLAENCTEKWIIL